MNKKGQGRKGGVTDVRNVAVTCRDVMDEPDTRHTRH